MSLKGKIVIITGNSRGIGLATSMALLKKGATVAGWSRSSANIKDNNYSNFKTDVSDIDSVRKSYHMTVDNFGLPDILINNAGIGYVSSFEELDMDKWHKMFDVNVHGMYYCSKMVVPDMKKKGTGHIINIGSIAGTTAVKYMVGYAATKHAVTGLSHSLFMELRTYGIKVSCIYPGSVKTGFFDGIDGLEAHDNMMSPSDIANTIIHVLESPPNYHFVDIEVRPLKPKG
jgi:NADP-dependent 3-hydroxy acid dehydrogenase YdfG